MMKPQLMMAKTVESEEGATHGWAVTQRQPLLQHRKNAKSSYESTGSTQARTAPERLHVRTSSTPQETTDLTWPGRGLQCH
ncbi:unnamed protein product [Gongylonema pulchrum]|uniref:Uncharacterized protein n=1 Tax=Gongylonema pulchrum TaxID=637853 RepID=A0A183E8H5_9BILA|nr:unnamed protein product [Gongylonema pulchrum]